MFSASFRLGKISGIEIGINFSLLFIAGLIILFIGDSYLPNRAPGYAQSIYWLFGLLTALLFFGSIVIHELAHALTAQYFKIPVRSIVLNLIGGIALIEEEAKHAHQMFWIALLGPLSSALFGLTALGLGHSIGDGSLIISTMLIWLGEVNLLLAAFNMIPGFPLDGGRVLLAVIWSLSGRYLTATKIAVSSGRVIALFFMAAGGLSLLWTGDLFGSLWWGFIGWFLWSNASGYLHHARNQHILGKFQLRNVLAPQSVSVNPDWPLAYALDMMAINGPTRTAPVMLEDKLIGVLALEQVLRIPRLSWGQQRVSNVMQPIHKTETLSPETPLLDALRHVDRTNVDFVVVKDAEHRLLGIIGIDELLRFVEGQRGEIRQAKA